METVLYRLKVEGDEVLIKNQNELRAAISRTRKEFRGLDEGSDRYKELQREVGALVNIQSDLNRRTREIGQGVNTGVRRANGSYNELRATLRRLTGEYKNLSEEQRKATAGRQLLRDIRRTKKEFDGLRASLGEGLFNNFFGALQKSFGSFSAALTGDIAGIGAAFGASGPLAVALQGVVDGFSALDELNTKVRTLRGEVQRLLNVTGDDLTNATSRLQALSSTFNVDENELLLAVNSLTENLTGDFNESLRLVESGFLAGADQSGDFLDILKEYPTFFREAKLSGDQFVSTIVQSIDQGVFSDKGLDAIKEATISLRELTPATDAALNSIGITSQQLQQEIVENGIGGAITLVQSKIKELEADGQSTGIVLADIFKGAGEDSGVKFLQTLDLTIDNVDSLIDRTNPLVEVQEKQLGITERLSVAQQGLIGETGEYITQAKELGQEALILVVEGLTSFIKGLRQVPQFLEENKVEIGALVAALVLYNAQSLLARARTLTLGAAQVGLRNITVGLRLAQSGLNAAFAANPIGFVITAIVALVSAFRIAYNNSEQFRASIDGLGALAKEVFTIIGEAVNSFVEGFQDLREGNFQDALTNFGKGIIQINPVDIAFRQGARLANAFGEGYNESLERSAQDQAAEDKVLDGLKNQGEVAKDIGKETGEGLVGGINEGISENLQALEGKKAEIERKLKLTPRTDPVYPKLLQELRDVEREILAFKKDTDEATNFDPIDLNTDPAKGSIKDLENEVKSLEDSLENSNLSAGEIRLRIDEIDRLNDRIKEQRELIQSVQEQARQETDFAILQSPDAISSRNILSQVEVQSNQELNFDPEQAARSAISLAERIRLERLNVAEKEIQDEERLNDVKQRINLEADRNILQNKIALAEEGSNEQLRLQTELIQKEKELQESGDNSLFGIRLEALRSYVGEALGLIQQFSDARTENQLQRIERESENELAAVEQETERRLENVEEGSLEEERIKAEQKAKEEEIERKAFQEEKKVRVKQAEVNRALAVGNALATTQPFIPAGLIAAGVAFARGTIEISKIKAQTFADGGFTGSSFLPPDRTGERPAGIVHENEYVIPRRVLETSEGRNLAMRAEKMRKKMGYKGSLGYYNEGGFVVPSSGGSLDNDRLVGISVVAEVSSDSIERIKDGVRDGSEIGASKGSNDGLQSGLRLNERRRQLDDRINVNE